MLHCIEAHADWPVYPNVWSSTSTACISLSNTVTHNTCWHKYTVDSRLDVTSVVSHTIVRNPKHPGFCLPSRTWSLLNHFSTGQGPFSANLHRWGVAKSDVCECGEQQTMNDVVDKCVLTTFIGRLQSLHVVLKVLCVTSWKPQWLQHSQSEMKYELDSLYCPFLAIFW